MPEIEYKREFSDPTEGNLIIPGELLQINVHYNSFSVRFQISDKIDCNVQGEKSISRFAPLKVFEYIYPINRLYHFFKANSPDEFVVDPVRRPKFLMMEREDEYFKS